jgi:hypothetical protein
MEIYDLSSYRKDCLVFDTLSTAFSTMRYQKVVLSILLVSILLASNHIP